MIVNKCSLFYLKVERSGKMWKFNETYHFDQNKITLSEQRSVFAQ